MTDPAGHTASSPVDVLRRWERSGAVWQVISRTQTRVEVALMTCTVAEVAERVSSSDPELLEYVGDRTRSDE